MGSTERGLPQAGCHTLFLSHGLTTVKKNAHIHSAALPLGGHRNSPHGAGHWDRAGTAT